MQQAFRSPVSRSCGRVVGYWSSRKSHKLIQWESQLERDCLIRLDADPKVRLIYEQPFPLRYQFDGRQREHIPDFLVYLSNGRKVVEVKPKVNLEIDGEQERFEAIKNEFKAQGLDYEVLTEVEIRKEPEFSNAKLVSRFRYHHLPSSAEVLLRKIGSQHRQLEAGEIEFLSGNEIRKPTLLTAHSLGLLELDLGREFSAKTIVSFLSQGEEK
ncbi:TnsA endonuclease-like protein [Aestuariispira insulae]|uniref:TnsA endonuclease-like protein n=2 Tax=Aestuariispira insulae TaxID=1461337 RepID=A0A3D9H8N2_9PROT|nr:TnsA endonuclease-like protein [Aestuariispira insulae]